MIRRLLKNVLQAYGGCTEPFGRHVNIELKNVILACINLLILLTPYQKNEIIQWENIYKTKWLSSGRPRKYHQLTISSSIYLLAMSEKCIPIDDTTLMAESEEELKSLLMRVKESEKAGLNSTVKN